MTVCPEKVHVANNAGPVPAAANSAPNIVPQVRATNATRLQEKELRRAGLDACWCLHRGGCACSSRRRCVGSGRFSCRVDAGSSTWSGNSTSSQVSPSLCRNCSARRAALSRSPDDVLPSIPRSAANRLLSDRAGRATFPPRSSKRRADVYLRLRYKSTVKYTIPLRHGIRSVAVITRS